MGFDRSRTRTLRPLQGPRLLTGQETKIPVPCRAAEKKRKTNMPCSLQTVKCSTQALGGWERWAFTFAKKKGQGYWRFASGLILGPGPLHAPLNTLFLKLLKHGGLKERPPDWGLSACVQQGRSSPGPKSKFLDSCGPGPFLHSLDEMSR